MTFVICLRARHRSPGTPLGQQIYLLQQGAVSSAAITLDGAVDTGPNGMLQRSATLIGRENTLR